MSNPYVDEHGMPIPFTRKERARMAKIEADAATRHQGIQPNIDPEDIGKGFDRCSQSKYQTHRFVAEGGRCCEFCGRHWRECLVPAEQRER